MWHRGRPEGRARSWRTLLPAPSSRAESVGAARRAVRVTVAAVAGFYPAVDLLDRPVFALYALFIPVAFGVMSPLPGSGRRRSGTVLRAVPAAAALITLGTYLAAATWSATLGMLVVGFTLVLAASIGPRVTGVVPALQLCYILACFPPYAPGTLPDRLAGLAVGATLTILCEWLLLPEPEQPSYRGRVADALECAARGARPAAGWRRRPGDGRAAARGGPGTALLPDGVRRPAHRGRGEGAGAGPGRLRDPPFPRPARRPRPAAARAGRPAVGHAAERSRRRLRRRGRRAARHPPGARPRAGRGDDHAVRGRTRRPPGSA
ncbi:hypothetical protein ACPCIZ_15945 [Streptomyces cellulosae]